MNRYGTQVKALVMASSQPYDYPPFVKSNVLDIKPAQGHKPDIRHPLKARQLSAGQRVIHGDLTFPGTLKQIPKKN
jgi:hypothetical protein